MMKRNRPQQGPQNDFCAHCCCLFIFIWIIPLLFVFFYDGAPTVVLVVVLVMFLLALTPAMDTTGTRLAQGLTLSVLAMSLAGVHEFYGALQPMMLLVVGKQYAGVYSQQPAIAFSDAAILKFAGNATVDETKAFSMKSVVTGTHTVCVAPITDSPSQGRVEFWAVGVDCCKGATSFDCDDAGDAGVNQGIVVPDPHQADVFYKKLGKFFTPPAYRRDVLLQAVKRAQSVHGIASSSQPVFVHWSRKGRKDIIKDFVFELCIFLVVATLIAVVMAFLLTGPLQQGMPYLRHGFDNREKWLRRFPLDVSPAVASFVLQADKELANSSNLCVLGFLVPFFTYMACLILWSWLYCFSSADFIMSIFMVIISVLIIALFVDRSTRSYGVLVFICALVGAVHGRTNYYRNTFHYCAAANHKSYKDVKADAMFAKYQDAGSLQFEGRASVSVTQSVGFQYKGVTYCAAPIMRNACDVSTGAPITVLASQAAAAAPAPASATQCTPPRPARADFWAVGQDCCHARGHFDCGGAHGSQIGAVLRDSKDEGYFDEIRENYLRAVRAAVDVHQLPLPKKPILVRWSHDVSSLKATWLTTALLEILISGFIMLLIFAVVIPCLIFSRRWRVQQQHRENIRRNMRLQEEEKRRMQDDGRYPPEATR